MSPISSFEKEYYKYARKINRAISTELDSEWYFRKGSQAEQAYKDLLRELHILINTLGTRTVLRYTSVRRSC